MRLDRLVTSIALVFLSFGLPARCEDAWGNFKGQVIWGPEKLPVPEVVQIVGAPPACLKGAPVIKPGFEVDPKTRGVRSAMVWLADAKQPKNVKAKIPVHPDLKKLKDKAVSFDQPCCAFEPYVLGIWAGQPVVAKNSATMPHSIKIDGGADNPNLSQLLPPGGKLDVAGWNPAKVPVPISCAIHPWMKGWVGVFNHPYFAVTNEQGEFDIKNAPAGEFRILVWRPDKGWVAGREGRTITIKAGETVDLGKIKLMPDEK